MSLENKNKTCVVCNAYLFDEDDVVYCPVCGAPHHRECYNSLGHCALEQLHGTENEYCRVKERREEKQAEKQQNENFESKNNSGAFSNIICPTCHIDYDINLEHCPNCGAENRLKSRGFTGFSGFDVLGGVPADYPIAQDVTANEAMRFVFTNTHRYIPKFAALNKKNKVSWNWMAFLFPCGWFLSRKMYKNGILAGLFTVITTLFSLPLNNAMYSLGLNDVSSYAEMAELFIASMPEIGKAAIFTALIGSLLSLAIRFVCGIFGDYFYKNHTVEKIGKIKLGQEDLDYAYRKFGGINIFLFFMGTLATQYLPTFIAMFI